MDKIDFCEVLNSFKGKNVFLTGHTGFKGTWLTFLLTEIGANVMGYAHEPESNTSHFKMLKLNRKIKHIVGDIRDISKLSTSLKSFNPEYVIHLAAQALVKKSYNEPVETFETNVMGSINLLEAVRNCDSVRSLVYITSDKCYENVEWVWGYRENDQLGGCDPYSASKGASEIAFSAYSRSFFSKRPSLGAASARAGNVIGGGDWASDRIIPDCIRSIVKNEPIQLRSPYATRPWQHVLEPLSGYLALGSKLYNEPEKYSGSWNFGPTTSEARTVEEVSKTIIRHLGRGSIEFTDSQNQTHEARLLQLNCDKAHQILGWYSRWSIDEALAETALWYKTILEGGDAEQITRIQIQKYFKELYHD
jgi:CDP-glucose 4,6-dehydratase